MTGRLIEMLTLSIVAVVVAQALAGCKAASPFAEIDWQQRLAAVEASAASENEAVDAFRPLDHDGGPIDLPAPTDDGRIGLSVEQAVVMAVRNNPGLAAEQLAPAVAGTFAQIEAAVFDPVAFAEAGYAISEESETSRATGEDFSVTGSEIDAEAGIRQTLPTGTTVEATISAGRTDSSRTNEQYSPRLGITLTQALLRGADPAANLVRLQQARLDVTASTYELRGFATALVAETERAYWQARLFQREIEIFEKAITVAEQLAAETRRRIDAGDLPESEQAAADAEIAQRRQDLIDARGRYNAARLRLLRLISRPASTPWGAQLTFTADPVIDPAAPLAVDEHIRLARYYRADVNEARIRLDQNRLQVIRTRDGLLPRLDFFITLGKTGFADSFSRSVRNAFAEQTFDFEAGLLFEYPLGNRAAQARDRQAILQRRQATKAVMNITQLAELDVRLAFVELERARAQIDASTVTFELRKQTLANEQKKLNAGRSTNLLVAQAQRDLLQAAIDQVEARVNYQLARIELFRLDGTLLARRGIRSPGRQPPMSFRP